MKTIDLDALESLVDKLLERVKSLETALVSMQAKQAELDRMADDREVAYATAVQFIRDIWLNKLPTKPRIIASAGRLLDKLGEK